MARKIFIGFYLATNSVDVQWYRPLSFGYLSSYLEKHCIYPFEMKFMTSMDQVDQCDIVCVSSTSQNFQRAIEIARISKNRHPVVVTILGGQHITYMPETLPPEFDLGVIGEGERTLCEVINALAANGLRCGASMLSTINGLVYHDQESCTITARRALIEPLDSVPFPHRSHETAPYLFTSRGCPYRCSFCSSSAFWDKTRFFSAEYVVEEISEILMNYPGITCISVWDDLFLADRSRFGKIVELIEQKGINKQVGFSFSVRANLVTDEVCNALKRMNVVAVAFGAESGSDRILKILGKETTTDINQAAIDTMHRHGISTQCSFIVGSPTETEAEVRSTYEFILRNVSCGKISARCPVNILMPIPGTPMWDYAVKAGIVQLESFDWQRLAMFASYQDSAEQDLDAWIKLRQLNGSLYLAEDTLPQERLYELIKIYDPAIRAFESSVAYDVHGKHLIKPILARLSVYIDRLAEKVRGYMHD
ncbi:MAG: radical SAM protein [Desulfuromonadales bacterium]|nr:MAG: radical SAM protein [Desulfuromonadales bacterium]